MTRKIGGLHGMHSLWHQYHNFKLPTLHHCSVFGNYASLLYRATKMTSDFTTCIFALKDTLSCLTLSSGFSLLACTPLVGDAFAYIYSNIYIYEVFYHFQHQVISPNYWVLIRFYNHHLSLVYVLV